MKTENSTSGLEAFGALAFTLTFGILGSLYRAYIVLQAATWFNFPYALTLVQWFGIIEIFAIARFSYNSSKPQSKTPYLDILVSYILLTLVWGILFIAHLFIK